jgi:hypothetical protein
VAHRDHFMAIKWRDVRDAYILNTAHSDEVIEAELSRGENKK